MKAVMNGRMRLKQMSKAGISEIYNSWKHVVIFNRRKNGLCPHSPFSRKDLVYGVPLVRRLLGYPQTFSKGTRYWQRVLYSHISTQIRPPFSAPNCLTWGTGFFCTMRTGRSWKSSWEIIRSRSVHSRPPVICRAFCSPMDISNTQSYVKQQTGVGRLYSMPKFKHLS